MNGDDRIDVHQHVVPPVWAARLAERGLTSGGWAIPDWSADAAIAMMDRHDIATGILSVTAPGVDLGDGVDAAIALAREVNDAGTALVEQYPDRFGYFASLPLPDVDAAVAEAVRALDERRADGVVLLSNAHGQYLGDPALAPLWRVLDERGAVVFVHPAQPPLPLLDGAPAPLADYVFDTTRSALQMTLAGVPREHPDLEIILAHGGGFVPYVASRFSVLLSTAFATPRDEDDVMADLRRFWFDTALSSSASATPALEAFAAPGHVLYGSDWPFAPDAAVTRFDANLDVGSLGGNLDVARRNAEVLFPRLRRGPAKVDSARSAARR